MLTKDAVWCFYSSLILSVFAMFFSVFFIPESPKYLHATGQFDECRKVLSYMAVCNGEDSEKMANVRFTQEPIAQPQPQIEREPQNQRDTLFTDPSEDHDQDVENSQLLRSGQSPQQQDEYHSIDLNSETDNAGGSGATRVR